jgi:hypothetical protein
MNEIRTEYNEIKEKTVNVVTERKISDSSNQIEDKKVENEEIDNQIDNRSLIIYNLDLSVVLDQKLKVFLEGFEVKIRSSVENAIKDKLENYSKTQVQEINETQRKLKTDDEDGIDETSIQEVFEELFNKLKEKVKKYNYQEKKLRELQIETTSRY